MTLTREAAVALVYWLNTEKPSSGSEVRARRRIRRAVMPLFDELENGNMIAKKEGGELSLTEDTRRADLERIKEGIERHLTERKFEGVHDAGIADLLDECERALKAEPEK